ncbi:thioredoxin-like protein [Lipomyces oligophaga]|uniref:thioredoxin-like protein n=1 Tax=Lipomyces oligophaga TaxID=45792 RepID=UPI0034CD76A5
MTVTLRVPPKPITLYSYINCPWAARTWIALVQANVEFEYVEIDLRNKPEWFLREINPDGKVPVLKYGDDLIVESAVTTELIADLFPKELYLADPFAKAQSKLMSDRFMELVFPFYRNAVFNSKLEEFSNVFTAIDKFLPYLHTPKPFFGGSDHPTLSEIMIAPFISRLYLLLESEYVSKEIYAKLSSDVKYKVFHDWALAILASPGVANTFDKASNAKGLAYYIKK